MDPDQISKLLKEKIIWLELAPETILNLTELAKEYKVSRTPVKEALRLLQSEEWVLHCGQHFMVTPLSIDRIRDVNEVRLALEVQAYIWAMERITQDELSVLAQIKEKMIGADENMSLKEIIQIDYEFHRTAYQASKNIQVSKILERLLEKLIRFWLYVSKPIRPQVFFKDALITIDAILERDVEKLSESSAAHAQKSITDFIDYFNLKKPVR